MKRKKKHEEHADEGWLLPYSDMMTLLLALFIVMFAMAKSDDGKIDQLSNEFNVIISGQKNSGNGGILPAHPKQQKNKDTSKMEDNPKEDLTDEEKKIQAVGDSIKDELSKVGHGEDIEVDLEKDGLRIAIQSGLLFEPGSAEITSSITGIVQKISDSLKEVDNELIIAGYTDNIPNNTEQYKSNWELSAARAISIMESLVRNHGVKENKVSIQAYGEFKPKVPNNSDGNRAKNRRVEIFIIKK